MRFRDDQNHERENDDSATPEDNGALAARRQRADEFYAAAQQAIDNVLSADSETFLESMEQSGGQ